MKSMLREIENEILKYAAILAEILQVDIEIVDATYFRVAGTGIYKTQKNVGLSGEAYIISKVMETGEQQIIENPREDLICSGCRNRESCKEVYEVCTPIIMEGKIIGAIGLVCFTEKQKSHIMWHHNSFIVFLNQIADLIASKAFEKREQLKNKEIIQLLDVIMNNLSEGVIVLNEAHQLVKFNQMAEKIIPPHHLEENEGVTIKLIRRDHLNNDIYELCYKKIIMTVRGRYFDMTCGDFHKVFLFSRESHSDRTLERYSTIGNMEEQMIKEALLKHGVGVDAKKRVAKELNIGIATLYRKIKKYNL